MMIEDRLGQSKGVAATTLPVDLSCQSLQPYQSPTPRLCIQARQETRAVGQPRHIRFSVASYQVITASFRRWATRYSPAQP
jgi:hypothetical protein